MLSNAEGLKLLRLANLLEVGRMAFVGDARQLGAVDAGKPFLGDAAGRRLDRAYADQFARARRSGARSGRSRADRQCRPRDGSPRRAHRRSAGLGVPRRLQRAGWRFRPRTAPRPRSMPRAVGCAARSIRQFRTVVVTRGELGSDRLTLSVLDRVSLTNEELRYAHAYMRPAWSSRSVSPSAASAFRARGPRSS